LKEVLFKLDLIAPVIGLLAAIFYFVIRKNPYSPSDRIVVLFLSTELILNTLAASFQQYEKSNLWIYHLNCVVVHILFSWYFLKLLLRQRIVAVGFIVFSLSVIILELKIQTFDSFPSYIYSISSFIVALYALCFLNQIIDTLPAYHILSVKEFWVIAGVLTYFGSSFFIFISYSYLSFVSPKKVFVLWQFHNIFLFFGCIVFIKAFNCTKWILK